MENRPRQKFFPAGVEVVATSVTLLLMSLCHLPQPLLFAVAQTDLSKVSYAEKGFYQEAEKEAAEAEKKAAEAEKEAAEMLFNVLEGVKEAEKGYDQMQLSMKAAAYGEEQLQKRIGEVLEEKIRREIATAKEETSKKLKLGLGLGLGGLTLIALGALGFKWALGKGHCCETRSGTQGHSPPPYPSTENNSGSSGTPGAGSETAPELSTGLGHT